MAVYLRAKLLAWRLLKKSKIIGMAIYFFDVFWSMFVLQEHCINSEFRFEAWFEKNRSTRTQCWI